MNDAIMIFLRIVLCVCWWKFVWKLIPVSKDRHSPGRRIVRAFLLVVGLLGGLILMRSAGVT
jgi:hypothetical protein